MRHRQQTRMIAVPTPDIPAAPTFVADSKNPSSAALSCHLWFPLRSSSGLKLAFDFSSRVASSSSSSPPRPPGLQKRIRVEFKINFFELSNFHRTLNFRTFSVPTSQNAAIFRKKRGAGDHGGTKKQYYVSKKRDSVHMTTCP